MIKLLIFDFDGTIADTREAYYSSIFRNLENKGFNRKEIKFMIDDGLSLKATLDKLGLGFIPKWLLHRKIIQEVKDYSNEINKCKNVSNINGLKIKKILVSNSLKEFIIPVVKHLQLNNYFKEIYGADDFSEKSSFIQNYLKNNLINPLECCYIGDRVADIKLAKKVGCIGIIVSGKCAWNSKKELEKAYPDFIIGDFSELKKVIEKLDGM